MAVTVYVGLNGFAEHSIAGTSFQSFDIGTAKFDFEGGARKEEEGTAGEVVEYRDMSVPIGTATTQLQTGELLACIKPAAIGSLPPIIEKIEGGVKNVSNRARIHEDCYLKTVKFSSAARGIIAVQYDWLALSSAPTTIASPAAASTNTVFPWHDQAPKFDTTDVGCENWDVTVDTGITAETTQDSKASGVQRLPERIDPGPFSAKLTATISVPTGFDLTDDFPAAVGFKVIAYNSDGTRKTFTLDLTGGGKVKLDKDPIEVTKGKEKSLFAIEGSIKTNDFAAFVVSLA